MTDARTVDEEFPAYDPKLHDPAACTRQPCRRCDDQTPRPPALKANPHRVAPYRRREPNPFLPLVPVLIRLAPAQPEKLAKDMASLVSAIRQHAEITWDRLLAWEHRAIPGPERGGGNGGAVNHDAERERMEKRQVAKYAQRARTATADLTADLRGNVFTLRFLFAAANPRPRRQLGSREVLAAQAAADGWCRSCIRVGVFEPIGCRPTGEPYWRDLCRWCGSNKGDATQPAVDMVRIHHRLPERQTA